MAAGAAILDVVKDEQFLERVVMELGGSDPFIILDSADLSKAAKAAAIGSCTNDSSRNSVI